MNCFKLILQDTNHNIVFDDVYSFVGEDASGSFSIRANHARFMTSLVMGLARFHLSDDRWQYIASPGALILFNENTLTLNCRHFFVDDDYMRISSALEKQLLSEETQLVSQKKSLRRMEEELFKRLWEMGRN